MVLIAQPPFILDDDGCAIAADADPKRIAPFAAASGVDRIGVAVARVLVENLAHMNPPTQPLPCVSSGCRATRPGNRRAARKARSGTGGKRRKPAAEHGEDPPFPRRPARGLKPPALRGETSEARWGGLVRGSAKNGLRADTGRRRQ